MNELCLTKYIVYLRFQHTMDYESFANADGGAWLLSSDKQQLTAVPADFEAKHMQYQIYRCAHTFKIFLNVALILIVVYMLYSLVIYAHQGYKYVMINIIKTPAAFTNMEGMDNIQYLGAATNVVRDDTGSPSIDLKAESVAASQVATTDLTPLPPTTQAFTERLSPEEEAMLAIKKTAKQ